MPRWPLGQQGRWSPGRACCGSRRERLGGQVDREPFARKLAAYVAAAPGPVKKSEAKAALGCGPTILADAVRLAIERGWIISPLNVGAAAERGYRPGPSSPSDPDPPSLAAALDLRVAEIV